jgi:hypothetical protein
MSSPFSKTPQNDPPLYVAAQQALRALRAREQALKALFRERDTVIAQIPPMTKGVDLEVVRTLEARLAEVDRAIAILRYGLPA